jgi:peptide/nickel transport system permease protein
MKLKIKHNKKKVGNTGLSFIEIISRELLKDKLALVSIITLSVIFLYITLGTILIGDAHIVAPNFDKPWNFNQRPSLNYFLGTDAWGRSNLLLLIPAARNSLVVTLSATFISTVFGVLLGLVAGYKGGILDSILMRIVSCVQLLPNLIWLIALLAFIGDFTLFGFTIILSLLGWTNISQVIRANIVQEKEQDYIKVSKTLGTPPMKVMLSHLLPNVSSVVVSSATLLAISNIGLEAGLSFLGIAFPRDIPSLGQIMALATAPHILQRRWWVWLPALVLTVIVMLCLNYLGRVLSRATDARQRLA